MFMLTVIKADVTITDVTDNDGWNLAEDLITVVPPHKQLVWSF